MADSSAVDWVKLANVASVFDAETMRAALESADILVQIRGDQTGIFGPGYQGMVIGGVDVLVPSDQVDLAQELLDGWE